MTYEQAEKLLEEKEDKYSKDGKGFVKGLLLIEKYNPIEIGDISAEHDVVHLPEFNEDMTEGEMLQLNRWGFHLDEDGENWAYFT